MTRRRMLFVAFSLAAGAAALVLSQGLTAQDKDIHKAEQAARDLWRVADGLRAQKKWDTAIKAYERSLEVMKQGMIAGKTLDTLTFGMAAKQMIEFCKAMPIDVTKLADGTYEGKAWGFAGEMTIEIKLEKGRIKTFQIKSQKESSPRKALEIVPALIIKRQNPSVDAVSQATCTSYGLMTATLRALQKAQPAADEKTKAAEE